MLLSNFCIRFIGKAFLHSSSKQRLGDFIWGATWKAMSLSEGHITQLWGFRVSTSTWHSWPENDQAQTPLCSLEKQNTHQTHTGWRSMWGAASLCSGHSPLDWLIGSRKCQSPQKVLETRTKKTIVSTIVQEVTSTLLPQSVSPRQ